MDFLKKVYTRYGFSPHAVGISIPFWRQVFTTYVLEKTSFLVQNPILSFTNAIREAG